MRSVKFLLILGAVLVINACKRDCFREIAYEEKVRLGYKGFETIVFKNNITAKKDTMLMSGIFKSIMPGGKKCKDDQESYAVSGSFKNRLYSNFYAVSFGTQIIQPENDASGFLFPVLSASFGKFSLNQSVPKTSITVNGHTINNVYELVNTQPMTDLDVDRIYFSFNEGLIRILMRDGKYWDRIDV